MKRLLALALSALGVLLSPGAAGAYIVDGNPSDWGVTVADHVGSCGNNTPGLCIGSNFAGIGGAPGLAGYMLEDTNDRSNSYQLGPNGGGQDYDAEFLAVSVDAGMLYILISTGQRADNGFASATRGLYGPGDIRILTSAGVYGIEVGGGAVGSSGAIVLGDAGTTYLLDSHGYTLGATAEPGRTAGSVWRDTTWINDPIVPAGPVQLSGGTFVGNAAAYRYTGTTFTSQHAIIEVAVDLGLFAGATLNGIEWRPSCGNDELMVSLDIVTVPEPATLLLLGLAAGGLPLARRRRVGRTGAGPAAPRSSPVGRTRTPAATS